MNNLSKIGCAVCASLLITNTALAVDETDTFTVKVEVVSSCAITANNIDFGTYDVLDTLPTAQTANIDISCAIGTPFEVGIDAGSTAGATVTDRKMALIGGSGETLDYTLGCLAALNSPLGAVATACLGNWGNVLGSRFVGVGLGTVGPVSIPMSASMTALQDGTVGNYIDSAVTATVSF